jgi:hypothetical protein
LSDIAVRPQRICCGRTFIVLAIACASIVAAARRVAGCDLCAIYTTVEGRHAETGPYVGVGEQYTYFGTLKNNGETVPNPAGERLNSSITQLVTGYQITPRIGVQLNFPIIARWFRRLEAGGPQDGDVSGFGDMSAIGTVNAFSYVDTERVAHVFLLGGLKFPTGNPDELEEELQPAHCIPYPDPTTCGPRSHGLSGPRTRHHTTVPSGIHGHDLALGSGSVDGIVGAQVFGSWRRAFATAAVQYVARTVGAFGYQYANDLLFEGGPGAFLALGDSLFGEPYSFGAQLLLSGETKGTDTLQGQSEGDTGITALYLGPAFRFGWGTHLGAQIGADLPVLQNNTQLQIVPDYRLRGGVTWRF